MIMARPRQDVTVNVSIRPQLAWLGSDESMKNPACVAPVGGDGTVTPVSTAAPSIATDSTPFAAYASRVWAAGEPKPPACAVYRGPFQTPPTSDQTSTWPTASTPA